MSGRLNHLPSEPPPDWNLQDENNPKFFRDNNNTGVLWKNNRRRKDSDPHSQGNATIDGVEYWLSGWTNVKEDGEKYIKISFKKMTPEQLAKRNAKTSKPQ